MFKRLKQDSVSVALSAAAGLIAIYLSTYSKSFISVFPAIILVLGLTLQLFAFRGKEAEELDVSIDSKEGYSTVMYTGVCLAGIVGVNYFASTLPSPVPPMSVTLSLFDQQLYGVLMAVAEEQFFRGFITYLVYTKFRSIVVSTLLSGFIFMFYHFAVYGSAFNSLGFVLFSGMILSYVTLATGRITPALLVHILNNILSSSLGGA